MKPEFFDKSLDELFEVVECIQDELTDILRDSPNDIPTICLKFAYGYAEFLIDDIVLIDTENYVIEEDETLVDVLKIKINELSAKFQKIKF